MVLHDKPCLSIYDYDGRVQKSLRYYFANIFTNLYQLNLVNVDNLAFHSFSLDLLCITITRCEIIRWNDISIPKTIQQLHIENCAIGGNERFEIDLRGFTCLKILTLRRVCKPVIRCDKNMLEGLEYCNLNETNFLQL